MEPDAPRTVCEHCKITEEGIVCDSSHGTRLYSEMTDEDVREFALEIFRLRELLVEHGPSKPFPKQYEEELVDLESKIVAGESTVEEDERYKRLREVYERYTRRGFQTWILERWASAQAQLRDLLWEAR